LFVIFYFFFVLVSSDKLQPFHSFFLPLLQLHIFTAWRS